MSYGYGVSATPLQLSTAVAAIVNDGVYRRPRIDLDAPVPAGNRVFSPETSSEMRKLMRSVVEEGAPKAKLNSYAAGGKTGTARFYDGGYTEDQYVSSFIGFAPFEDPTLLTCVVLDRPQGVYYGGAVAAPVFKRVMDDTLPYVLFSRLNGEVPEESDEPRRTPGRFLAQADRH